ncbi:3-deoxy-manno-octulosonate cytidylyltransferase [Urechidicola vernalis]|uniref:3-deoxy-manno-octulosonate cytidylyltransferase n=1 Tax=Urechidicola vernalis TaxID=3075600 RepID=A0ABU2Y9D3_9FLAO|nr:3-deoxy-manno-octulosonate cytidylyltransferase [Urechidicola sp. P050]MDT0553870.1 3-deoxy-manno-octulosonate cytidylyltransferase [Urechidicola sp. P050]
MKIVAMIPARLEATRFPKKLMQDLGGMSVIVRTYRAAVNTDLFNEVYVVTDSEIIFDEIVSNGGKAILSKKEHESGSDRIAEAIELIDADIVVNVQGDEPFIDKTSLENLLTVFKTDSEKEIDIASLMFRISSEQEVNNPNNVKVVTGLNEVALYFSRAPIPFPRDNSHASYFKHIGIYAFRKQALLDCTQLPMHVLEQTEKLEQLRFLANGYTIKMVLTDKQPIGIDTPEDLHNARELLLN